MFQSYHCKLLLQSPWFHMLKADVPVYLCLLDKDTIKPKNFNTEAIMEVKHLKSRINELAKALSAIIFRIEYARL